MKKENRISYKYSVPSPHKDFLVTQLAKKANFWSVMKGINNTRSNKITHGQLAFYRNVMTAN